LILCLQCLWFRNGSAFSYICRASTPVFHGPVEGLV
jgi:hypothetical protein